MCSACHGQDYNGLLGQRTGGGCLGRLSAKLDSFQLSDLSSAICSISDFVEATMTSRSNAQAANCMSFSKWPLDDFGTLRPSFAASPRSSHRAAFSQDGLSNPSSCPRSPICVVLHLAGRAKHRGAPRPGNHCSLHVKRRQAIRRICHKSMLELRPMSFAYSAKPFHGHEH